MRTILITDRSGGDSLAPTSPTAEWLLIKPFDPGELLRAINATARDEQS